MNARYARQMALPGVGATGQARLANARVLVVGAGGLGCPVLQYLAGAGVGQLRIVDHDRVEESNLHRQPLYAMGDLGTPKVQAAKAALGRFNPAVRVEPVAARLTPANADALLDGVDVVVDAADSFAATYTLSDTCHRLGRPLVGASAVGLGGYVGAFCGGAPSYRAVFPELPAQLATCASAGVLGPVVATLGGLQAQFVLQLLLGLAPSPLGRLVSFDANRLGFGSFRFDDAAEPARIRAPFIAADMVRPDDVVVDLRSLDEAPVSPFPDAHRLTPEAIDALPTAAAEARVVLCCRSGLRAWRAADRLAERGFTRMALLALGDTAS